MNKLRFVEIRQDLKPTPSYILGVYNEKEETNNSVVLTAEELNALGKIFIDLTQMNGIDVKDDEVKIMLSKILTHRGNK